MNINHLANLETLLKQKKFDEVKKMLTSFLGEEMSGIDKGELLVKQVELYLDITSRLDAEYITALKQVMEDLDIVAAGSRRIKEKVDLHKLRQDLNR